MYHALNTEIAGMTIRTVKENSQILRSAQPCEFGIAEPVSTPPTT